MSPLASPSLVDPTFWRGRRVLLTGHTGFKGGWAALWLDEMGAHVEGLGLDPDTQPSLFEAAHIGNIVAGGIGDLRDADFVARRVAEARPDIVLHMAAQPLVRRSVREPVETIATNVLGTANLLAALRDAPALKTILVVTTDKVYENNESGRAFREADPLGGHDPYAASKAAAEIIVASFARTYFEPKGVRVGTARGGNVIGGGDFSEDRIVPDIFRALQSGEPLKLRNPNATRPWQHVLDCLEGYFAFAQALTESPEVPRALNFGPLQDEQVPVARLAAAMQQAFGVSHNWQAADGLQPREMQSLSLDCTLSQQILGFRDRLVGNAAITATADWYLAFRRGEDAEDLCRTAIRQRMSA